MEYSINTDKLKTMQTMLTQNRQKLLNKSNVFYAGAFSSTNILSSALGKIKRVYGNIPDTLENIRKFLEDYVKEIENYENLIQQLYFILKRMSQKSRPMLQINQ